MPNRGIETASAACRCDALPTELHSRRKECFLIGHHYYYDDGDCFNDDDDNDDNYYFITIEGSIEWTQDVYCVLTEFGL